MNVRCLAHPWLTFIIALAVIDSVRITIPWRSK